MYLISHILYHIFYKCQALLYLKCFNEEIQLYFCSAFVLKKTCWCYNLVGKGRYVQDMSDKNTILENSDNKLLDNHKDSKHINENLNITKKLKNTQAKKIS